MSVEKDLSRMAVGESLEDDAFEKFKDRISHEPEQVSRLYLVHVHGHVISTTRFFCCNAKNMLCFCL